MSQVKTFKIKGEIRKGREKLRFHKEIRAVKKEDALATLYSDLGSRHKARRFMITISSVEESSDLEAEA